MLGYVGEPDFIKGGCLCKPLYNGNDEAAARTQASTPKLPAAETHCIVICPLDKCDFEPDLVLCYGGGERVFGLTGDDEVAFAIPACKIKDTADGIIAVHKGGVARIPTPFAGLTNTPAFPKYYDGLAEYCGLK